MTNMEEIQRNNSYPSNSDKDYEDEKGSGSPVINEFSKVDQISTAQSEMDEKMAEQTEQQRTMTGVKNIIIRKTEIMAEVYDNGTTMLFCCSLLLSVVTVTV